MKRIRQYCILAAAGLCLAGCSNFAIPKSISVATSAEYKFTVADLDQLTDTFTSTLDLSSITQNIDTGSNNFSIYSYNPDGKSSYQQMLIRVPVQEIPVDVSQYFDSSSITSQFNPSNTAINQKIKVPEVSKKVTQKFPLSELNKMINEGVVFFGAISLESNLGVEFDDALDGFDSITYKSGTMVVTSAKMDGTNVVQGDDVLTGSITLVDKDGNVIASATFTDSKAVLDISGAKVTSSGMKLRFSNEDIVGKLFLATISEGSEIERADGVSLSDPINVKQTLTLPTKNTSSEVISCVIEDGSMEAEFTAPMSWKNVDTSFTADMTGGFTCEGITNKEPTSLNDTTFSSQADTNVEVNLSVKLSKSTLVFTDEPEVNVNIAVNKLKSGIVKASSELVKSLSVNVSQKLPDEALETLSAIKWGTSKIKLNCKTDLPAGNDISIKGKSDFFGIDKPDTIKTGVTDLQVLSFETTAGKETKIGTNPADDEYSSIDFNALIELPGYDSANETFEIKELEANKEYSIEINVETVFDWESISLDISGFAAGKTGNISTGINPASLFGQSGETPASLLTDCLKQLDFESVSVYLFCNMPDNSNGNSSSLLSDISFNGIIKAFIGTKHDDGTTVTYTPVSGIDPTYFLGKEGRENMKLADEPILSYAKDNPKEIITDIRNATTVTAIPLEGLLNNAKNSTEDAELCFDYDIKLAGADGSSKLTINKDDLAPGSASSISIAAYVILPMQFRVTSDNFSIDLMSLLDGLKENNGEPDETNGDILQRKEPWFASTDDDDETMLEKLLGILDKIALTYTTPSRVPLDSKKGLSLSIDLDGPTRTNVKLANGTVIEKVGDVYSQPQIKNLSIGDSIEIKDPKRFLEIYPLKPSISINAEKDDLLSIPRDIGLSSKIGLVIATNGEPFEISQFDIAGGEE